MTAPTGCHTCGGGAGRHDEAAHSDWPAEVDHRPYWNEVLDAEYCTGCGDDWPCLPYRQTAPPRCKCSHSAATHGTDRRGRAICWSAACGCASYRPQESK